MYDNIISLIHRWLNLEHLKVLQVVGGSGVGKNYWVRRALKEFKHEKQLYIIWWCENEEIPRVNTQFYLPIIVYDNAITNMSPKHKSIIIARQEIHPHCPTLTIHPPTVSEIFSHLRSIAPDRPAILMWQCAEECAKYGGWWCTEHWILHQRVGFNCSPDQLTPITSLQDYEFLFLNSLLGYDLREYVGEVDTQETPKTNSQSDRTTNLSELWQY